jgi:acetyl esterase
MVAGDSAGGNMAAVCALRARDRGGPALAGQILVYPVVDHDPTTPSYLEHGANEMLLLESKGMRWFWDQYVPDAATRDDPDASPLRAAEVSGLAPAIVVIAEYDPLRDEGLAYAERLRAAGVPVTVHRYDDMPHAFFTFVNLFKTGNRAVERVGAEARQMLDATPR